MAPKVSIIIVTYNNVHLTRQCLASVYAKTKAPDFEVIIIDNASADETPAFLSEFATEHPQMRFRLNTTNEGFAGAVNQGAAIATGDFLLFLNNDTVVTEGWLSGLIRHLQEPDVGMVGPVTNSSGNESRIPVSYGDITEMDAFAENYTRARQGQAFEIPMLAFLCVAMPRSIYEEVGPLDERFGIGMFEDDDYAIRIKEKGYKILCAEDVFIHHWGGASFSLLGKDYFKLFLENLRKFEEKWRHSWHPQKLRSPFQSQQLRELVSQNARMLLELAEKNQVLENLTAEVGYKEQRIHALNEQLFQDVQTFTNLTNQIAEKEQSLRTLSAEVSQKIQTLENLSRELLEKEQSVKSLRAQLIQKEKTVESFTAQLIQKEKTVESLTAQLIQKEKTVESLTAQLIRNEQSVEDLTNQVAEKERATQTLTNELQTIMYSDGWALLQILWRIRLWLAPRGSRRERIGRSLFHIVRHTRRDPKLLGRWLKKKVANIHQSIDTEKPSEPGAPSNEKAEGKKESHNYTFVRGLVSVVLPVYNQAHLLEESIESVLSQTYQHYELIVVNDGSTDNVEAVLDKYVGHPKIRILHQLNLKLPKALSNGFAAAIGEYWTWTSADNIMDPQHIQSLVDFLQSHPEVTMVYADYTAIDDWGNPLIDPAFRPHNRREPSSSEIHVPRTTQDLNIVQDNFIGPCFLYRGIAGRIIGDYEDQLGVEDYDYWMRMNNLFSISHLGTDDLLYRYRVHQGSLNARAEELGIFPRVKKLIRYEAERQEFYRKDWTIIADAKGREWLARTQQSVESIQEFENFYASHRKEKTLFILTAATLRFHPEFRSNINRPIALLFDENSDSPYSLANVLSSPYIVSLVSNPAQANTIQMISNCPILDLQDADSLRNVLAFSNNRIFYDRSREVPENDKRIPDIYWPSTRPLHILLQVDDFNQGGMEKVVIHLAQVLEASGTKVTILILGRSGEATDHARLLGLSVEVPGTLSKAQYREFLTERKIDLVNAHYSTFGASLASSLNIPFVQTIHNSYVWLHPLQIQDYQDQDPYTSAYICVSRTAAQYADAHLKLSREKMIISPNGIDSDSFDHCNCELERGNLRAKFGFSTEDFVFLNAASVHPTKAQHQLIQAFSKLIRKIPAVKLVLLGKVMDEVYFNQLESRIKSLGLENNVFHFGFHTDVSPFYAMADAFVLPSFWEGWSLSFAEALYSNLPVVSTSVGAAEEFAGLPGVELITPSFGDTTALHYGNLHEYIYRDDPLFEDDLVAAMMRIYESQKRPNLSENDRFRLRKEHAYQNYIRLFRWLAQGGKIAGIRRIIHRERFDTRLDPVTI